MSIKAQYPDMRPTLFLDFTSGKRDIRLETGRPSLATYCGKDGYMKIANWGEPRIDYDPFTGKCLGLLMEPSTINLAGNHRAWGNGNYQQTAVSGYTKRGPDGQANTAKEYVMNTVGSTGGSTGIYTANYGITATNPISVSAFVKVTRSDEISFQWMDNNNAKRSDEITVYKDARTPVNKQSNGGSDAGNIGTTRFQQYKDGWVRLTWENVTGSANATSYVQLYSNDHTAVNGSADNVGYAIWGIQIEAGWPFCTSPVLRGEDMFGPDHSNNWGYWTTRTAERTLSIIDPPFSFPATVIAGYNWLDLTYARRPFSMDPGAGSDAIRPLTYDNGNLNFFTSYGSVSSGTGVLTKNTDHEFGWMAGLDGYETENGITYDAYRLTVDGAVTTTAGNSNTEAEVVQMKLGYSKQGDAPRDFAGHIKYFHVYNNGMTDNHMRALTGAGSL